MAVLEPEPASVASGVAFDWLLLMSVCFSPLGFDFGIGRCYGNCRSHQLARADENRTIQAVKPHLRGSTVIPIWRRIESHSAPSEGVLRVAPVA